MAELASDEEMYAEAATRAGVTSSEEEFMRDAVNTYLAARKDIRIKIAVELYQEGKISLGRACELADLDYESMKEVLAERGVKRRSGAETSDEVEDAAEELLGRSA